LLDQRLQCGQRRPRNDGIASRDLVGQRRDNPESPGVRRGMKIFRLSWWVLPMVSVGTVAVIAAILDCIVVLLRP
jgi:hypothetical protein